MLEGRWPDAQGLDDGERRRRADEYWRWVSTLADRGVLVAAGDLRWEAGERLAPGGAVVPVDRAVVTEANFVVGLFALRVNSYDEALAVARACPHLRYGGSVSIRRVSQGFVTVPSMGDGAG